jgi:DNA-binding transcriptional LysR family regulator
LPLLQILRGVPRRCALAQLSKFPFILYRKGSRMQNEVDRYFTERIFPPTVIMSFDNADAIKAMVRAGLGISMLPFWVVDEDCKKGLLFITRQKERPLFSKFDLVRRKSNYTPGPVGAFIETIRGFQFRHPRLMSSSDAG